MAKNTSVLGIYSSRSALENAIDGRIRLYHQKLPYHEPSYPGQKKHPAE